MSTAYYYFAASLPLLSFDAKAPMTLEQFLEDCRRLMSPADYEQVLVAVGGRPSVDGRVCDSLTQWKRFEEGFLNDRAAFRAGRAKRDPQDFMRGEPSGEGDILNALSEAAKKDNPQEAEAVLDRLRWQRAEDLSAGHPFDLDFLVLYAVKIKILERWQTFASPAGGEVFDEFQHQAFHGDIAQEIDINEAIVEERNGN